MLKTMNAVTVDKQYDLIKEITALAFDIKMDWQYNVSYRSSNSKASYRRTKKNVKIKQRHLIKLRKRLQEIS